MSETLDKALKKLDEKVADRVLKASDFLYPTIEYLKGRAREDESMAEDIIDKDKSMNECCTYIFCKARKRLPVENGVWIKNETIYEWAEDYWRATAEDIKKVIGASSGAPVKKDTAKPEAKKKAPAKKAAKSTKVKEKSTKPAETVKEEAKDAPKKPQAKPKKQKKGEPEGQMNLFDFIS